MTSLLNTLETELGLLDNAGNTHLDSLLQESSLLLSDLRELEAELEDQVAAESQIEASSVKSGSRTSTETENPGNFVANLERKTQAWYTSSIGSLKQYNSQVSKFSRNTVGSSAFSLNLDDAYTFPLPLDLFPTKNSNGNARNAKMLQLKELQKPQSPVLVGPTPHQHTQLMRSIVLHFLKTGHGGLVADLLSEPGLDLDLDQGLLRQFLDLGEIVGEIREHQNLSRALRWLEDQATKGTAGLESTSFKFHMLQFVLLLSKSPKASADESQHVSGQSRKASDVSQKANEQSEISSGASHVSFEESQSTSGKAAGGNPFDIEQAFSAYTYAKTQFQAFFKDHVDEISPVFSLLLFKTASNEDSVQHLALLKQKVHRAFLQACDTKKRHTKETKFVAEVLENFDTIKENAAFFDRIANEFVQQFCKASGLSTESSLFQAILAGHVNLPNFYKFSKLQQKLRRSSVAETKDLPFSLSSRNHFLFNFHPIFICPISKEQLVPLSSVIRVPDSEIRDRKRKQIFVSPSEVLVSPDNPVVVFEHCRHLALKESVRHLTKGGVESFKCHYCYKKHKFTDVTEAYFIDL